MSATVVPYSMLAVIVDQSHYNSTCNRNQKSKKGVLRGSTRQGNSRVQVICRGKWVKWGGLIGEGEGRSMQQEMEKGKIKLWMSREAQGIIIYLKLSSI